MKYSLLLLSFLVLFSCKKNNPTPSTTTNSAGIITLDLTYTFDSAKVAFDSIWYINKAGNPMTIENLQYFIGDIELIKSDGTVYTCPGQVSYMGLYCYMDARMDTFSHIKLTGVPYGNYTGLYFNIGLDSMQNMTGMLPDLNIYNNIQWPTGSGGYHFLKLEGHYKDTNGAINGYTMHIGEEKHLIKVKTILKAFTISSGNVVHVPLQMNVAGWFKDPNTYNFNSNGNYTMGNEYSMGMIAANGCNVFNY